MADWLETPEPGIYPDVPAETYHRWDAMSATWLAKLGRMSPKRWKKQRDNPPPSTPDQALGNATHVLAGEPFDFADRYAVAPDCDRRTKAGKATWAAFAEQLDGRKALTSAQYHLASAMAKAVQSNESARKIISGAQAELSIVWIDEEAGVTCKARLDWWQPPLIPDLKTTSVDVEDSAAIQRAIVNWRYYVQAAFYADGARAALNCDKPEFVFVFVDKADVPEAIVYPAGASVIEGGRFAYHKALEVYKNCKSRNEWPGPADVAEEMALPDWVMEQEINR